MEQIHEGKVLDDKHWMISTSYLNCNIFHWPSDISLPFLASA